eukprot:TRINITY_DN258_c0_g1_i2.p1 TRINITY_DN258_c0_g1~~TRINITY_DN258_c0_g1_i2.p1  ORF type:complete len:257 (-),score=32.91 TRINITY_DN258_c0_g1_i2:93-863(-)
MCIRDRDKIAMCDKITIINNLLNEYQITVDHQTFCDQLQSNSDVQQQVIGFQATEITQCGCLEAIKPDVPASFTSVVQKCQSLKSRDSYCYMIAHSAEESMVRCLSLSAINTDVGGAFTRDNICDALQNNQEVYEKILGYKPIPDFQCGCTEPEIIHRPEFEKVRDECLARESEDNTCYYIGYGQDRWIAKCEYQTDLVAKLEGLTNENLCEKVRTDEETQVTIVGFIPKFGIECQCQGQAVAKEEFVPQTTEATQ